MLNGSSSNMRIDADRIIDSPVAMVALISTGIALLAGVFGTGLFLYRGTENKFTWAILSLVIINFMSVQLQASEIAYVYLPSSLGTLIWRNVIYQLCVLSLNLLQLEIFAVFNAGLMHVSIFRPDNMKWVRLAAIIVHLLYALPIYLQGWVIPMSDNREIKWTVYGAALYTLLVGIWGVFQNCYILAKLQAHFAVLNKSIGLDDFHTSNAVSPCKSNTDSNNTLVFLEAGHESDSISSPVILPRRDSRQCLTNENSHVNKRVQNGSRVIQLLIFIMFALDITCTVTFIISSITKISQDSIAHYAHMQISVSIIGIHLFLETFLFTQIVDQFRKKLSATNSSLCGTNASSCSHV
ncbi:expressed protein [Batrachochytrium dendrobatidis JAM81]|uniref:Expressed protein n=1 Tax=Batrachochytrium dendrobatidis (strain JAM81 / FGSC 10211) TaxID=684364 RepID=F4P606_BATDJ|nr:uncharacterized protein BATDEDRAFT_35420 [Batrachochytrium dendrobatidis JAM81]EGF79273.1 expressed protein [Batrachochytrium dendrobatidis JAM81]|eukprot:XP_006679994.1 expressed protein [Batrachochytrium dendrobatidis JAM81]